MQKKKQKKKPDGLGDSIQQIAELLNLDKLATLVANAMGEEDCGCERRKERLNELFPYKKKDTSKQTDK